MWMLCGVPWTISNMSDLKPYMDRYGVSDSLRSWLDKPKGHFIGGRAIDGGSGQRLDVIEPYTGGVLTTIPKIGSGSLDAAVAAAQTALFGAWGQLMPLEREQAILRLADLLEDHTEEFAQLESLDVGKAVRDARSVDVAGSVDNFRYFAGWASKLDGRTTRAVSVPGNPMMMTLKEPVGVVAAIVPWNFPLQTLVWKLAAALACGCTCVVKPSEITPLSALRLAELATEAGLPDGVINVVNGIGIDVAVAMAKHPGIQKITFTGSTPVGHSLGQLAVAHNKRMTLELGGKSPVIVTNNADLERAATAILGGVFLNTGQVCDAGSRVYVQNDVADALVERLAEGAKALPFGPGLDPKSAMTPLVSRGHAARVRGHIAGAHSEGAQLVTGMTAAEADADQGNVVPATIFDGCDESMSIVREEVFGPVLAVSRFQTLSEAIARANSSIYGLASAVYSRDIDEALTLTRSLRAGNVYVNAHGLLDPAMPFGGLNASGFGKDMGPEQLDSYLETKAVYIDIASS